MAEANVFMLRDATNSTRVQGILDAVFTHQPGQKVAIQRGLRAGAQQWAFPHINLIDDTCWCRRACKQYFVIFAKRVKCSSYETTIVLKAGTTTKKVEAQYRPKPGLAKGSSVEIGEPLFVDTMGAFVYTVTSPIKGLVQSITMQTKTGQNYIYQPQISTAGDQAKPKYVFMASGNNSNLKPQWITPTSLQHINWTGTFTHQLCTSPTQILTVNPITVRTTNYVIYPAEDQEGRTLPKYKMRVVSNYKHSYGQTMKQGCPLAVNVQSPVSREAVKGEVTEEDKDFYPLSLEIKASNSFKSQYSAFNRYLQSSIKGTTLHQQMALKPYGAYAKKGTITADDLVPGYSIKFGDYFKELPPKYSYWAAFSNQRIGFNKCGYNYTNSGIASGVTSQLFPQDQSLYATDSKQSDHYRCTSPYSVRRKSQKLDQNGQLIWTADEPTVKQLQAMHWPSSSQYPLTDYASTYQDKKRTIVKDYTPGEPPEAIPLSFQLSQQQPANFWFDCWTCTYQQVAQGDKITYKPKTWTKVQQYASQDAIITAIKARSLGYSWQDYTPKLNVAVPAGYTEAQVRQTFNQQFSFQTGIRITYAYPSDDCSTFKVGVPIGVVSWLWKRGSLGMITLQDGTQVSPYNQWMLLQSEDSYCGDVSGFIQAPAILNSYLPVDTSGSCLVYVQQSGLWHQGDQNLQLPKAPQGIKPKQYSLELWPYISASQKNEGDRPDKLKPEELDISFHKIFQNSPYIIGTDGYQYYYQKQVYCDGTPLEAKQQTSVQQNCKIVTIDGRAVATNYRRKLGDTILTGSIQLSDADFSIDYQLYLAFQDLDINDQGTILKADQQMNFSGSYYGNGTIILKSCYQSQILELLKPQNLPLIREAVIKDYYNQVKDLQYPNPACPNCQQDQQVKRYFKVYPIQGGWTYQQIQKIPKYQINQQDSCVDIPQHNVTRQKAFKQHQETQQYSIKGYNKYGISVYKFYKRCTLVTTVDTYINCQQSQPQHTQKDFQYYIEIDSSCWSGFNGQLFNPQYWAKAVKFFQNPQLNFQHYPDPPKAQFPCGTDCNPATCFYQLVSGSGTQWWESIPKLPDRYKQQGCDQQTHLFAWRNMDGVKRQEAINDAIYYFYYRVSSRRYIDDAAGTDVDQYKTSPDAIYKQVAIAQEDGSCPQILKYPTQIVTAFYQDQYITGVISTKPKVTELDLPDFDYQDQCDASQVKKCWYVTTDKAIWQIVQQPDIVDIQDQYCDQGSRYAYKTRYVIQQIPGADMYARCYARRIKGPDPDNASNIIQSTDCAIQAHYKKYRGTCIDSMEVTKSQKEYMQQFAKNPPEASDFNYQDVCKPEPKYYQVNFGQYCRLVEKPDLVQGINSVACYQTGQGTQMHAIVQAVDITQYSIAENTILIHCYKTLWDANQGEDKANLVDYSFYWYVKYIESDDYCSNTDLKQLVQNKLYQILAQLNPQYSSSEYNYQAVKDKCNQAAAAQYSAAVANLTI